MAEDKMVKDVRSRLKSIAAKGGKYFTGTAKLFLASGAEIVNVNMPTLGGMMDVNRDLMNDTVRFLRNPVDVVNKNIDRAMSTEGWKAFQKFAKNALDDLKTGDLYDPMRDRSSFGEGIDALLDNFGDFDMSGFDEAGDYQEDEAGSDDFDRDVALAESHEQAEDVRTQATIEAIGTSTKAVVNTQNANAQTNIRLSIKQHAQAMGAMENMVTQQAATLTAVNAMASSLLDVQREAHNQMMEQMTTVTNLLTEIRDNTSPKATEQSEPSKEDDIIGAYGQIDVRKWLKAAYKNADEKYGISSTISMATGGMDVKTMLELAGDNPLQLVSDFILGQIFDKTGVKTSMERTGKYMQGFFPALLDKLADRGRRFGKTQEEGGGKLTDLIAGILGVQTKAKGSIETGLKEPSAQASITNRTVQAIEQVIPMWLSKIYSAISGDPLQMYNYSTGKLTNVAQALAKQHHDVNDVAGRMGGAAYQVTRRAEAIKFGKVEDQEKFSEFMYQFLQKAAKEGRHIDPWKSEEEWNEMLPNSGYGPNEEYFSKVLKAVLRTMPRSQLMALSSEASDARVSQTRAAASLNNENRETGMGIIHSGMAGELLSDEIEAQSKKARYGMSDVQVEDLIKDRQIRAVQTGTGVYATNIIMNDVLSTLKRGILTYTYIIGDSRNTNAGDLTSGRRLLDSNGRPINSNNSSNPSIPGLSQDILDEVLEDAGDIRERIGNIRRTVSDERRRTDEWKAEQQKQRDEERRKATRSNLSVSGIEDVIFDNDMNEDDMARVLQHLIVTETKDNESDNPEVERSRGYITSHIQKFKSKIGFDPKKTLGDNLANIARTAPFELIKSGLELSDALMFKVIFGQDTEGLIDGTEDQPSLMRALSTSIKGHWKQAATWFGENIGKPLKDFLFNEKNGLMTRLSTRVQEIFGEPIKRAGQKVKTTIIGEKEIGEDGKPTGRYVGGKLSNTINRVSQRASEVKNSVTGRVSGDSHGTPGIIDKFLYGDYSDTKRKGVKYVRDRGANGRFSGGHYEYQGFMGKLNQAGDQFTQMLFGPDADGNDHDSKKKAKFVADELNKAAPDMIIGAGVMTALNAGMGLLTGLALPGGPLVAPLLGAGLSFVSSSETFKKFLFGDQIEEEQEHYDMKTGKMVKSKVKTRKGSDLISKEVYEGIKRFAPKVTIGAMAGALAGGVGLLPFGMGPIIGSVLGSIGGMTAASDQLKKLIFGDSDSEEGDDSGLISKNFRKKLLKGIVEHGGGAVVGRIAGGAAGMLAGGILPGALGAILGPVLGTAGTVIGAVSGPKLMDMLFGEEQEISQKDEDGKETGKTVKKRVGGMFGKMFDGVKTKMVEPLAKGIDTVGHKIGDWFQESVVNPFDRALQPMKDAMTAAGNAVKDTMKNIVTNISDNIRAGMEKVLGRAVENPLKDFFQEKIIKPLTNVTNRIFSTIGKIIGNIISAPFKAVEYIFAGTIGGKTPDDLKDERQKKKDAERNTKLTDKLGKAKDSLKAASSNFGRIFNFLGGRKDSDAADTAPATGTEDNKPAEKKGFFSRLRQRRSNTNTTAPASASDPTGAGAIGTPADATGGTAPVTDSAPNSPTAATGNTSSATTATGKKRRWVRERGPGGRFTGKGHYEDIDEASSGTGEPKPSDTGTNKPGMARSDANSDERKRLKDKAAAKNAEKKERENAATSEREKREEKKAQADAAETAKKNGRKKSNKTDNEYLKDIEKHSRSIPKIFEEINGQLGNTGWNLGYIKKLLEKQFGKLSAEELPEEMEGSRKNVKKRRGFFGKMFDRVAGVFGGIGERIRDTITGAIDIVLHPFRLLGKAVTGVVDIVKGAGETLWGIAKTIGSAIGDVLKGAAQGIGTILAGAGKAIYAASSGIGKALGDTLATLTGVLKDGILGLSSVVRGLVETAAAIAPDLAKAAWKGMKFVSSMVGKGIKFAAEGVAGGVSWLFNKIIGRDKDEGGERTKTKIKKLGKFVIDGGYLDEIKKPLGIAIGGDAMIPFPYVSFLKGKLTKKSNIAIPVYIMGAMHDGTGTDGKNKKDGKPQPVDTGSGGTPLNRSNTINNDEPSDITTPIPVKEEPNKTTPKAGTEDTVNGVKGKWVQNREGGKFAPGTHFEPYESGEPGKPQGAKPRSIRDTAANAATKARAEIRKKVDAFKRKYFNVDKRAEKSNNPAEEYDRAMQSATSQEEINAVQAAQQMNVNGQLVTAGSGDEEKKKGGFLSGLLDFLTGGKGTGILSLLKGALPTIAALGAGLFHFKSDKGNKAWGAEIVGNEALRKTGLRSLSPAQILEFIKNPTAAKEFAEEATLKGARRGAKLLGGLGSIGSKVIGGVKDFAGMVLNPEDARAAIELGQEGAKGGFGMKLMGHAANGLRTIGEKVGGFASKIGGAVKSNADDIMRAAAGSADDAVKLGPVRNAIAKAIGALMSNKVVQSAFGALKNKIPQITSKLSKFIGGEVLEKAMKSGAANTIKNGAKQIAAFASGGLLAVGFAIYDFTSGMGNAKKYFKVYGSDVTLGMRLTAGICNCLGGLIGLIPVVGPIISIALSLFMDKIVQLVYNIVADDGAKAELDKDQKELEQATAAYNQANGTELTTEEYSKKFNKDGSKVTLGTKIGTGLKTVRDTVGGFVDKIPIIGTLNRATETALSTVNKVAESIPLIGSMYKGIKSLAEHIPLLGGVIKGLRGFDTEETEEEPETGKGPGDAVKRAAMLGFGMMNPVTGMMMAGGSLANNLLTKNAAEMPANTNTLSSVVSSLADKITGAINTAKGVANDNGLDTSSVGGLLSSALKDPKALLSAFMSIGKGVGGTLIDMVSDVFKDKKKGPTIFSIMGEGLGSSLIADLKETEGKNATISNSMSTAMTATLTGGDIGAAKRAVQTSKKGFFGKVASTVSSWMPWNWGKGPEPEEETNNQDKDTWGHGPVSPMSQSSGKWNRGSRDMAMNGCGPTAAAMVASAYGDKGANPGEANRMSYGTGMRASDGGTNPDFFSKYANAHGYGMSEGPVSAGALTRNLRNGQPAVVMGKGGAFGKNMHYMVADRENGHGGVGLVDPLTGSRKTTTMKGLMSNTKTAIYSYGRGAWGHGPVAMDAGDGAPDGTTTGTTPTGTETGETGDGSTENTNAFGVTPEQKQEAQDAVVNQMKSVYGKLRYTLSGGGQNPDNGTGSCASTVGWAYRKALGVGGMSANAGVQALDTNFTTVYQKTDASGKVDPNQLEPGDLLYIHWDRGDLPHDPTVHQASWAPHPNYVHMSHAEMYVGDGKILSHGGPNEGDPGPVWKDLNDYRAKRVMLARRYTPLIMSDDGSGGTTGDGSSNIPSDDIWARHDRISTGATATPLTINNPGATADTPTTTGGNSFTPAGSMGGTRGTTGTTPSGSSSGGTTGSSGGSILDALSTMFSGLSSKLGNLLTILMGGTISDTGSSDAPGGTSTDPAVTPPDDSTAPTVPGDTSDTTDGGTPTGATPGTSYSFGDSAGTIDATETKGTIWRFLRKEGYSEPGAAGIMGCWENESYNRPDRLEGDYLGRWKRKWGSVDDVLASNESLNDYTKNYLFPAYGWVDNSAYRMSDGNYYPGVGLAQWTASRAFNLFNFAKDNGLDWRNIDTQLQFFKHETETSYPNLKASLNAATTPEEGARAGLDGFEMYSGWSGTETGQAQLAKRAKSAAQIYNTFHGTSLDGAPEGKYFSTGNAADDMWKRGEGLQQVDPETVTTTTGTTGEPETETGKGWGRGSDAPAVDLGHARDTTLSEIRRLNTLMEKTRDAAETDSTAATIAGAITDAMSGGSTSSNESTAMLKTIADAICKMVPLLEKISKNTEQGGGESDVVDDSASGTNKRRSNLPVVSPLYPNQDKKPEDVGLTVVNQLTTV